MLVFNKYSYKKKKSKLYFEERVAVLNDFIYQTGGSTFLTIILLRETEGVLGTVVASELWSLESRTPILMATACILGATKVKTSKQLKAADRDHHRIR
jgi:hypothetical protein